MLKQSPHDPTTEASSGDATRAHPSASESSSAAPSPAVLLNPAPVIANGVVCAGCRRTRIAPGKWEHIPLGSNASHGLCPECADKQRAEIPHARVEAQSRVLRHMIQGNLDMARRLIGIGDAALALRELEQATTKIDQFLNQLT
jgi:hypothetical protein